MIKKPKAKPKKRLSTADKSAAKIKKAHSIMRKVVKRKKPKDDLSQKVYRALLRHFKSKDIEKEYVFHPTRKWRLDYAIPQLRLGIEVHGGVWSGGRHVRGMGFQKDREKMNEAAVRGWIILELTDVAINSMLADTWIAQAKKLCDDVNSLHAYKCGILDGEL